MLVLLPLEVATGYLYMVTKLIIDSFNIQSGEAPDLLNVITDVLTESVIEVKCPSDDDDDDDVCKLSSLKEMIVIRSIETYM